MPDQEQPQHSAPLRRPSGYRFVRLPHAKTITPASNILKQAASGALFSGKMVITIETLSPLHIGDGTLQLSEDLGFAKGLVVKSILHAEKPIIPGTTLKGVARTHYEAITKSCVSQFSRHSRARYVAGDKKASNLPQPLVKEIVASGGVARGTTDVVLLPESYERKDKCPPIKRRAGRLCPSCLLFGARGFAARVSFSDAELIHERRRIEFLFIPSGGAPRLHSLGRAFLDSSPGPVRISVDNLKGRKFYYAQFRPRSSHQDMELWDYVPPKSVFRGHVYLRDISRAELGGLFAALGIGENVSVRIGAGKAIGLGKVSISAESLFAFPSGLMQRISDDSSKPIENLDAFVDQCKKSFLRSPFAFSKGLEALRNVCRT